MAIHLYLIQKKLIVKKKCCKGLHNLFYTLINEEPAGILVTSPLQGLLLKVVIGRFTCCRIGGSYSYAISYEFLSKLLNRPVNEKSFLVILVGYAAEECWVPGLKRKELKDMAAFYE